MIEGKASISPPRFLFGSDLEQAHKLNFSVYREGLKDGRILDESDRGTLHALLSRAIADQFKKKVGEKIHVDGMDLEIVGIYSCNSLFLDVAIILDIELVRRVARIGDDSVCNFYVEPDADADRDDLTGRIKDLFRGRAPEAWQPVLEFGATNPGGKPAVNPVRAILSAIGDAARQPDQAGGDELPVEVRNSDDWAKQFKSFSEDLNIFLLLMTGIGVSIAFVGIVNTMLMSVTERFIEFGILKANGWSNAHVLRLIAFESALLGVAGGLAGSVLGWVATLAINAHWPTRIHLYAGPRLLVWSIAFSTILGVLGGLYPAIRASRMMPMDAIRRG
jgi:putative ABC transport system permease protein